MRKIPTLFKRDPEDMRRVIDEVHPDCQWVLDGEGVATRKYDGTCVMLDEDGKWWARREVKPGKTPPPNWVEADHDETTGKRPGWEPIDQAPFVKFFLEARADLTNPRGGTYELCGPKVNGNPEGFGSHVLVRHAIADEIPHEAHRDFDSIRDLVKDIGSGGWEGIVWHHPDGRMAKLKARDFPAYA